MPNTAPESGYLHVVAAVIRGEDGRILLSQRPLGKHQGGKWEFPGGKLEVSETPLQALGRELDEELGIQVSHALPLIKVRHVYPERAVLLDVWEVTTFIGKPHGREGQPVAWFESDELQRLEFPAANYPIITAARLPGKCLVTPEPADSGAFLEGLAQVLRSGIRLIQFRAKSLSSGDYLELAGEAIRLAHEFGAKVILNSPPEMLPEADGLHLTSRQLAGEGGRGSLPLSSGQWLSAACHNVPELQAATKLGVDFAFLAPVLPTRSHPGVANLGWESFQQYVDTVNFPVYALGGMRPGDFAQARSRGGQGIAAISSFWSYPA